MSRVIWFLKRFVVHVDTWTNKPFDDRRELIERQEGKNACAYWPADCGHSYVQHSPPHRFVCWRFKPGPWVPVRPATKAETE